MGSEPVAADVVQRGLVQQGYVGQTPEQLSALTWPLRFTPSVCMVGAIIGLATQSAWLHFILAALGMSSAVTARYQPVDLLYNHVLSPLFAWPKLPPNPVPRRAACAIGGLVNLGIGFSFRGQMLVLAYSLGAVLVVLQLVVISSHFCLASWMLEKGATLLGRRKERLDGAQARELVQSGALLVDVRSPAEYDKHHLQGAVNIPVSEIEAQASELASKGKPLVLYCASGARSHRALKLLSRAGLGDRVHDLGSIGNW